MRKILKKIILWGLYVRTVAPALRGQFWRYRMAELEIIDEIVAEISKKRGVDLSPLCLKLIVLSYWMYCVNTYDVLYENEDGERSRLNSGCIVLCQKGTGKSRALKMLKKMFSFVEVERLRRYDYKKEIKIGKLTRSMIPLNVDQKKEIETFYVEHGVEPAKIFTDVTTSKNLCETYAQAKNAGVNNILFSIDEAGDKIFKDAYSKSPSISAREFLDSINQLFDGYCGMGQSRAAKVEGIKSQTNVGANFIFVSTAEFLKDYHVQQRYQSSFEGGIARRLLFLNCPPIDKLNADRTCYKTDLTRFEPMAQDIFSGVDRGKVIKVSAELWDVLQQKGAGCGIIIDDEYLLLLFCTALAVWTKDNEIQMKHWNYMTNVFGQMKEETMDVVKQDTTSYDKICVFIRETLEASGKKKIQVVLVKDFCVRNKMCFESKFKKWFDGLCLEFTTANTSKYLIEKNQLYVWLSENFAFEGK